MTSCECCHTEFQWGEILNRNLLYGLISCRKCGCEHTMDFPSRFKVTLVSVVPFLVFGLFLTPFDNTFFTIVAGLFIFVLGMLISPFVTNYKQVKLGQ
ncbi:cxxc_20_cxxc protein [Halobacillus alkaliphilus]|uniref:Cxxc_20_cxxc protein n=1 Tax=Halobacillus alkaliphilus TaxID=396056 RepID=A0A1I2JX44_9BACI|nr:cxxc_20_cxxc protein [Halobacillus alkaliphilus]